MTVNELYKKTYNSAADKLFNLGGRHKKRARKLIKHSDKAGIDSDVHNIFYHEFNFDQKYIVGKYFISGSKIDVANLGTNFVITVLMSSTADEFNGITISIIGVDINGDSTSDRNQVVGYKYNGEVGMRLKFYNQDGVEEYESRKFIFDSRKDVIAFKQFLKDEYGKGEYKDQIDCFLKVPINNLWK